MWLWSDTFSDIQSLKGKNTYFLYVPGIFFCNQSYIRAHMHGGIHDQVLYQMYTLVIYL